LEWLEGVALPSELRISIADGTVDYAASMLISPSSSFTDYGDSSLCPVFSQLDETVEGMWTAQGGE